MVGALGVVFGDIGTSPIYTIQTVFNPDDPHPVPVSTGNVYGVVPLVFWSVTMIVTVTYVSLAMRISNDGEGDSMITPAISVLSAVEGLEVIDPSFADWVVPITAVIIVGLFAAQRFETEAIGRLFGPVMIAWFVAIGSCGIWGIGNEPEILRAISPTYAVGFLAGHFHLAFSRWRPSCFRSLVPRPSTPTWATSGTRRSRSGWIFLVFPACALSYFGQGALILEDHANLSAPFFLLTPDWARIPMIVLATAATVIASQAVITGAFSVASQAARLGYLPRVRI